MFSFGLVIYSWFNCADWFWCNWWQPLADAEGAKKNSMIELLKSYGGLSYVSYPVVVHLFWFGP